MAKSEHINELATALAKAQPEIKSALKDSSNPFFKSKYADLHSTWEACREALNKNGLSIVQTICTNGEESLLITTLLHQSGQWIEGSCPLLNQKKDMQGLGSAISYARRYSIAAICGVVSDDDDANAAAGKATHNTEHPSIPASPDKISEKQAKMVFAKLASKGYKGLEQKTWLMNMGYHFTEDIPYNKLNDVLEAIEKLPSKLVLETTPDYKTSWNK